MAGDWIKVEVVTPDKPEVHQMADILQIDPDAVVGKLLRIWIWADQQTYDGNAHSVTKSLLDRITCVTGFADAMQQVGWLTFWNNGYTFPRFSRHNGKTAKRRAQAAKRVESHRKCNAESVTDPLQERYQRREEKRREEIIPHPPTPSQKPFDLTPEGLAQAWCFYLRRKRARKPADDPVDMADAFTSLVASGAKPDALLAEIRKPDGKPPEGRDRSEYFWQFKKRFEVPTGAPAAGHGRREEITERFLQGEPG